MPILSVSLDDNEEFIDSELSFDFSLHVQG